MPTRVCMIRFRLVNDVASGHLRLCTDLDLQLKNPAFRVPSTESIISLLWQPRR
jgi:hypothetical protein